MKIGIFGGCFNPPHIMHKEIANTLINNKCLDKVIFVPTGNNYSKAELIDINKRIDMLKLIIDNENILVSEISKDLNYNYTFKVLDYYQNIYKNDDIYFLCGTDNLSEFKTWKKYEYILTKYRLLVILRNDDNIYNLLDEYTKFKDNIEIADVIKSEVSSTFIRNNIKSSNFNNVSKYLDESVLKYIQINGLYKK